MFGLVWNWVGQFRRTETNLGVDWTKIRVELRQLVADVNFWVEYQSYLPDEVAIRFKHRLVAIHSLFSQWKRMSFQINGRLNHPTCFWVC
jgi:fido (protein-threonine AMPylation protein)